MSGTVGPGQHHTGVLEEWAGGQTWWNERVFVLFTTTVIILLPLCSLKHIGNFFTQIFFPQILISNLSVLSSHVLVPMVLPCCFLFLMCLIYSWFFKNSILAICPQFSTSLVWQQERFLVLVLGWSSTQKSVFHPILRPSWYESFKMNPIWWQSWYENSNMSTRLVCSKVDTRPMLLITFLLVLCL
jgi:hypothetical protein